MAAPHVFLVWTIKDAKGKSSVMKMNMPDSADIAIAKTFIGSTAQLIDPLIKGQIVDLGIGLAVDLPGSGLKTAPLADSDVEEGARFSWRTAVNSFTNFRIPTFDEAKMVSGTPNVDLTDTDVDDFVQRVLAGQTVGLINVSPSDDRGEDITELSSAREDFTSTRH